MGIFLKQMLKFYSNNATNLHLTSHSTPCCPTTYFIIMTTDDCDVTLPPCISYNKSSSVAEMGDRGHNRHGPKREGVLLSRGGGSPYNTVAYRPRPTSVPSGILMHLAVWPQ